MSFSELLWYNMHPFLSFFRAIIVFFIFSTSTLLSYDFVHPSDVVREMQARFKKNNSYSAKFFMKIKDSKKVKLSQGKIYYRKGGFLNFEFSKPYGDRIVSNSRKMWLYVAKLNAVGIQDLSKGPSDEIINSQTYKGLVNLFRRYHYRFKTGKQPNKINGKEFYILSLTEKVASGGYENLTVYVDAKTYQIQKMEGISGTKKASLRFESIETDLDLPDKHFKFKIKNNMKVVENPLTIN